MENGLGSVDASEKAMKNEITESRVEEKAKVGYHESKASVGDEDFKDSIAAEVPTILSGDMVISPVDNVGNAGILNRSVVGHKKADSGIDFEKFEEAVDFPIEDENQGEKLHSIEDTKEVFVAAKPIDKPKVDEVGIGEGVMKKNEENELDRVENDLIAHKKTDSGIDSEKFEEAVDVLVDSDKKEEQLSEVCVGVEPVDKSVAEITNGEVIPEKREEAESNRVANDDDVAVSKQADKEIKVSDLSFAANDKEIMEEEKAREVDIGAVLNKEIQEDAIVEKHENGVSDDVGLEKTLAHEVTDNGLANVEKITVAEEQKTDDVGLEKTLAHGVTDNGLADVEKITVAEEPKTDDVGLEKTLAHGVTDNGLANVEKITVAEEPKTVQSLPPVNSDSPQAVGIVESLDEGEKVEEANKISSSLDNGHEDKKSFENNGDAASEIHINSVEEVNPSSVTVKSEFEDEKNDEEVEKETAERPKTLHENGTDKEIKGTAYLAEDNRVENIEERNHDLAPANLDRFITNGKTESCVEKKEEIHEVERSPISENVVVDRGEKVQENASDKDVKGAKVSQIETADKSVKSPNADTKKDETVRAKQNTQGANGNSTTLPARPAGLGRTAPLLETAPRVMQQNRVNGTSSQTQSQIVDDVANGEAEENDETREKLQMIRVKFLRLAHRLGQTPHNVVVAQVLYRLGLAEQLRGRNGGRVAGFSFDRASAMAEQLEAAGQEPLDFSCTVMVLGKSGVGKSSTINSIFDEVKFSTDAFQQGTKKVQDVVGTVQGIKVRVIDTPGLLPSWSDQRQNEKILLSVKRFIKKTPPDIVLYLDRLDMQTRDLGDMPLLRTITDIFGPSIWFNAIVVLTHAASAPPEGANGTASSYEMFVTNRSHVVQQAIRQAAGDMRLMNPVSLVENHSACRKNRAGQRVLPNGQVWKPHLLLLSFASKILAEANTLLKLQDSPPGRPFATRTRAPPLPYLLSSLLQSRPQLKLPEDQLGDDEALGEDVDESSDSDDDSEYDDLPPFKRLTKDQLGKLTKNQKKAYYEELEYREKLFMKKQLKEEKKRRKMMKKMAKEMPSEYNENIEEESGGAASVPVPMPDLALPASFDSDNPTHRYRYIDSHNSWVVRPVLDPNGWDHDIGYEGVNVEKLFVVKEKIPVSFSGQITKDKKDANMQMEMGSSIKHGEGKATTFGLDMQSLGKDMAYTLRTETKFSNYKKNKATAGFSVTKLGDSVSAGVKIEDQLIVNKRLRLVASGGAMTGRGDMAYGGSFEATLRDKDHPLGRSLSTLGLSVMDWHGDLAIGGNIQSQIPIGRSNNLIARANLNNKGSGQVSIRLNSSEQLQIVLIALVPLIRKLVGHVQLSQFGQ